MAELNDREPVWVVNVKTGVRQPIAGYKTKNASFMRRNDLKIDDERFENGVKIVAPMNVADSVAAVKAKLESTSQPLDTVSEPKDSNTFEHDGMQIEYVDVNTLSLKELKERATAEGIEFSKNASKATMLELLSNQ